MEHGFILQNHKGALLNAKFAVNQHCQILLDILTGEAALFTGEATLLFSPLFAAGITS